MDSVAGVHQSGGRAEIDQLRQEIAYKDEIIAEKDAAIDRLLDRSRIMEAGVAARDDRIGKQNEEIKECPQLIQNPCVRAVRRLHYADICVGNLCGSG